MMELPKRSSKTAGLPPGTLVHVGQKRTEAIKITVINYESDRLEEKVVQTIEDAFVIRDTPAVTWINVDGLQQIEIIEKIGHHFGLHPLTAEDILNTTQRPKLEDLDNYLFLVLKMPYFSGTKGRIEAEQVSIVLTPACVISFQEREGDVFDPIRERIRNNKGRIRKMNADYLAYTLVDAIVDGCFVILEAVGERMEELEEELVANPKPETLRAIYGLKREMILLRKAIWPLREVISNLMREETSLVHEDTRVYLRDVYDHTIQVVETIETFRDMISGMLDIYLSSVSNRMNEVMKVLTIIATVFIPLTFVAGIYGMNFKYMPELDWPWSYPVLWAVMLIVAAGMFFFFRRKRWI